MDTALERLPHLVAHLLRQVGHRRTTGGLPGGARWEAPLPFNVDAFDDANALWVSLLHTAQLVATRTGHPVPRAAERAWRDEHGEPLGFHVSTTPADALNATTIVCGWIAYRTSSDPDAWLPVVDQFHRIAPKWPLRDRPRDSTDAVCPRDRGAISIVPPRHHGDDRRYVCRACGLTLDETQYDLAVRRYAAVVAHERVKARADAARERLMRKYVTA